MKKTITVSLCGRAWKEATRQSFMDKANDPEFRESLKSLQKDVELLLAEGNATNTYIAFLQELTLEILAKEAA